MVYITEVSDSTETHNLSKGYSINEGMYTTHLTQNVSNF